MNRKYKNIRDRSLVFQPRLFDEQSCRRDTGVPSGTVTFDNKVATFTTDGKITFDSPVYSIKSIRLIVDLDTTTEDIITLASGISIETSSGTLTGTGINSPTVYVDGTVTTAVTAGKHEIVITTTTAFDADAIVLGYVSSYLEGDVYLLSMFNSTLSQEEVSNLYNNSRYVKPNLNIDRGAGLTFNGADQYAYVADNGALDINQATTDFCFDGKIKTGSDITTLQYILGKVATAATDGAYGFYINAGGLFSFSLSSGGVTAIADNIALATNTEYYALTRYDLTNKKIYFYIDGVLQNAGGTSFTGTFGTQANVYEFYLGAGNSSAGSTSNYPFGGQLKDIRIYHKDVTSQIADLMDGKELGDEVLWLKCNEKSLTSVKDSSANGRDLTLVNAGYATIRETKEILNITAQSGVVENKFEGDTIDATLVPAPSVTDVTVKKEGEVNVMDFGGSDSPGLISSGVYDDLTGDITLSTWLYPKAEQGGCWIFATDRFYVYSIIAGNSSDRFAWSNDHTNIVSSSGSAYPNNMWIYVALVRRSTGLSDLYINGSLVDSDLDAGSPVAASSYLYIGSNNLTNNEWKGKIGYIKITKGLLTAEEISQIYSSEKHKYNV